MTQNKALWIFPNIKESVDILPPRLRGKAWEMIINYAFGDEKVEESCSNLKVLFTFRTIKPLLRLRGIAGSQNGKSNNPSGLAKNREPNIGANIGANLGLNLYITETETEKKEKVKRNIQTTSSDKSSDVVPLINKILNNHGLSSIKELTSGRKSKMRERCKELGGFENFLKYIDTALAESSFLRGENDRRWRADFDFFLQKNKMVNVLEGKYKDKNMVEVKNNPFKDIPVDVDLLDDGWYDFRIDKYIAGPEEKVDWSKYNRELGVFEP